MDIFTEANFIIFDILQFENLLLNEFIAHASAFHSEVLNSATAERETKKATTNYFEWLLCMNAMRAPFYSMTYFNSYGVCK